MKRPPEELERLSKIQLPSIKDIADSVGRAKQEEILRRIKKVSDKLKEATDACKLLLEEIRRRRLNSRTWH
jgi:hypothetical protein